MNREERLKLEDRIFDLSNLDMLDIEAMTDDDLIDWMTRHELAKQAREVEQVKPERESVQRSRERAPRVKRLQSVKLGETFVEKDGKLYRRESWLTFDMFGSEAERDIDIPCGQRVRWEGRLVSASVVLHWVRTGERVYRVPKPLKSPAKPFRAVVWHQGKARHLGCFATAEERDAATFAFKLGLTP